MKISEYHQDWMKVFAVTALAVTSLLFTASCSKKSAADRDETTKESRRELAENGSSSEESSGESSEDGETDEQPDPGDIGEDCVAFLRATSVAPVNGGNSNCPTCPANEGGAEVLQFTDLKVDRVSPSAAGYEVAVRIFATFNPSRGGAIVGGLTGWISPEQRAQYARGETPSGQQMYKVNIHYRRNANGWQPVEFN